jgi:hypothetical protein
MSEKKEDANSGGFLSQSLARSCLVCRNCAELRLGVP